MIGIQLQNYKISKLLGRGGMATVYLVNHQLLHNKLAVKVLNQEFVRNVNIRNRFLSEARNMASMSHPNIIKVTDLIDAGDTVAFVMEYIEGDTLKDYIDRKGKLSDEEIKTLFSQMLDAVGYVHEQNLVHRDIKPSNFMITPQGQIKLLDFGIAKNTDSQSADYTQTGTGIQMGTPMYMSPEQVKSSKDVGFQSDIYSLGVVLWQMVMGKKPYDSDALSSPEIQVSILKEPLIVTNTKWDSIVQKATAKDILNRYVNCFEIKKIIVNPIRKSKISPEEPTLASTDDKTIVEKESEIKNKKTVFEVQENSKHNIKATKNIYKYWRLFLFIIPILLLIIYKYPFESEVIPAEEVILPPTIELPQKVDFPSVMIGNQEWMTENLNVDTFRNGDPIPEAKTVEEWKIAGSKGMPAWCYYNNDPANGVIYGKLYNWYAVNDSRGLAPEGWHIPNHAEWTQLSDLLGGGDVACLKMKSTSGWNKNGNGTNEIGFSGLPGGFRYFNGQFVSIGYSGFWWSSSEDDTTAFDWAWYSSLKYYDCNAGMISHDKSSGVSVRCIRDSVYGA